MENNDPPTPEPAPVAEETLEQLKETIAEKDRQYSEMKAEYEAKLTSMKEAAAAQHAEAEKLGKLAEESALAGKAVAEENANLKARIAELEANAKTAEQIAAEKYGTGTTPINAVPGGKSLAEGLQAAREQGPTAFRRFVKDNREHLSKIK